MTGFNKDLIPGTKTTFLLFLSKYIGGENLSSSASGASLHRLFRTNTQRYRLWFQRVRITCTCSRGLIDCLFCLFVFFFYNPWEDQNTDAERVCVGPPRIIKKGLFSWFITKGLPGRSCWTAQRPARRLRIASHHQHCLGTRAPYKMDCGFESGWFFFFFATVWQRGLGL